MKGLLQDLNHAWRIYRRTPISSAMAVVVLAVAMAFVAAFFSLYVDLILRPHPGFEQSNRVVSVGWNNGQNASGLRYDLIERIAEESTTLDVIAGTAYGPMQIGPEQASVIGELVTRQFFTGLRPRISLGRGLEPTDHDLGSAPVAVISHDLWQRRFDGRNDVLGETITVLNNATPIRVVEGRPQERESLDYQIVGVMVPQFTGTTPLEMNEVTSLWVPVETAAPTPEGESAPAMPYSNIMRGLGRRAGNASPATIISELTAKFQLDLEAMIPLAGVRFDVIDGLVFNVFIHRDTQRQLLLFLSASILLALVAAANVSLFLLARAPGRRREIGIRMSVGAPLKRIARQLTSEAVLLVAVAATLGLLLSIWLAEFLRGLTFLRNAQWRDVALFDWRVLTLVGVFLLILTVLVSLAPILGLKRLGIAGSSRQVAARATVAQRIAGTAQIAIAGTLGGAAIAFGWYLGSMMFSSPGYETRNVHAVNYQVPPEVMRRAFTNANTGGGGAMNSMEAAVIADARVREALLSVPGVTNVSMSRVAPGVTSYWSNGMPHPDDPNDLVQVRFAKIDDHFVDVLRVKLLSGRLPAQGEAAAVVNKALARRVFGRDDVIGERINLPQMLAQSGVVEIVGMTDDISFEHPSADVQPVALITTWLLSTDGMALIESARTPAQLRQSLEALVEAGTLEMSITDVRPFKALRNDLIAADRARSFLTIGTALLVVVLAAVGFYGTQRYLVTAGRREYAIRASLGAGPKALGKLVFVRGLLLGLPGLVFGTVLAFIVVAWLRDDFVSRDVSPWAVTMAVVVAITLVLLIASFGPARHARRTEPAPLLRED